MTISEIYFQIPTNILSSLNQSEEEFTQQSRLAIAIELFKTHKLSSGQAAELAGMGQFEFWMELGKREIPLIDYDPAELEEELERLNEVKNVQTR